VAANRTKPEARVAINPTASQMGAANAILRGRARQYHVAEFPGPLSFKSVVRGWGVWGTAQAERVVDSGSYLVLNAGRPYSLTIDAREVVETFCLFFRAGFAEDVHRVESSAPVALLDEPVPLGNGRAPLEFFETLHPHDAEVSPLLRRMRQRIADNSATDIWLEDQFFCRGPSAAEGSRTVGKAGGADSREKSVDAAGALPAVAARERLPAFLFYRRAATAARGQCCLRFTVPLSPAVP
jgi:hypothetical protein